MVLYKQVNGERIEMTPEEEEAIRAEWAANDAEKEANAWKESRINAYPQPKDQFDSLWHDIDNGLFGEIAKTGDFYNAIKTVKDTFPKPS